MGQIYVPATASAANGIRTMDASGGGITTGGAWLYWTSAGYTGQDWYWNEPNNYLQQGWSNLIDTTGGNLEGCDTQHDKSYESFLQHVQFDQAVNLDNILGGWTAKDKSEFILVDHPELENYGCVEWN